MKHVIFGCGDVGKRIARDLLALGVAPSMIVPWVNSQASLNALQIMGLNGRLCNLDEAAPVLDDCNNAYFYYTVAPQKSGLQDRRSRLLTKALKEQNAIPRKILLISTTGVYGDHSGDWVDETSSTAPSTQRAKRRADSETVWHQFAVIGQASIVVLRVPGIYANSRLPTKRILNRTPVVNAQECGYSNRIHADDLAAVCIRALERSDGDELFNASDGRPGTITEYLQAVAQYLGEPPLPEISLADAQSQLSPEMLSYLTESRKISNTKLRAVLAYEFKYSDFNEGLKH